MISPQENDVTNLSVLEPAVESSYTLDVVAHLTGVSEQTILHYQEQGLLHPTPTFDDEALLHLRRIEHLRSTYEANLQGVKLMLELMDEIEHLQRRLRARR